MWALSIRTVIFLLSFLLCNQATFAKEIEAQVVQVLEGDRVKIEFKGKRFPLFLWGIQAPEIEQPFGIKSRKILAGLVDGRTATIKIHGADQHKNLIGEISLVRSGDPSPLNVRFTPAFAVVGFNRLRIFNLRLYTPI